MRPSPRPSLRSSLHERSLRLLVALADTDELLGAQVCLYRKGVPLVDVSDVGSHHRVGICGTPRVDVRSCAIAAERSAQARNAQARVGVRRKPASCNEQRLGH